MLFQNDKFLVFSTGGSAPRSPLIPLNGMLPFRLCVGSPRGQKHLEEPIFSDWDLLPQP